MKRPVTLRLSDEEIELIDVLAHKLTATTGVTHSRPDVIRTLLHRAKPGDGADNAEHRRAYQAAFPA